MLRVLIVEDQTDFYENYILRLFAELLPMEKISVAHAPTLEAAAQALEEPWDVILMDYSLDSVIEWRGLKIHDGFGLTAYRRQVEAGNQWDPAYIIGMSSSNVGNRRLVEAGANLTMLKLQVPEMAKAIAGRMK